MAVSWSDQDDTILGGDLAVALAYCTPAGGAVVATVAPIGLRDRERGEVTFTTSLGLGKKLERMRVNPHVSLAYHAREHGFATDPRFVLVQGTASFDTSPDQAVLDQVVRPASVRFMGPPKTGFFWDRYLREYYADRVLVTVAVERVIAWPDLRCAGRPEVSGTPLPAEDPPRRRRRRGRAPARGSTSPRPPSGCARCPTCCSPSPAPTASRWSTRSKSVEAGERGIALHAAEGVLPHGGRRAGLLGHRFNAKLIGLESRQHTGWLEVDGERAIYAPHTRSGFRAPANKTLLLLGNGLMAKRGLKKARAAGAAGA